MVLSKIQVLRRKGGPVAAIVDSLNSISTELNTTKTKVDGLKFFVSSEQTGTGEQQEITHNLQGTPSAVLISLTSVPTGGASATLGTHTSTKIRATVTNGAKYQVVALRIP